jgi:hypothetical protein
MKMNRSWLFKTAAKVAACIVVPMLLGCEQARVDAQMEKLCKQDGGMKIHEKVVLPKDQFTQYGDPIFFKTWNKPGGGYKFISEDRQLKSEKPTLSKATYMVIREADSKILGTYVSYLRIGGGLLPRLGPDPAKLCPDDGSTTTFLRTIFVQTN